MTGVHYNCSESASPSVPGQSVKILLNHMVYFDQIMHHSAGNDPIRFPHIPSGIGYRLIIIWKAQGVPQ